MTPDVLSQSIPTERRLSIATECEERVGIADVLTANGKIDRPMLPATEANTIGDRQPVARQTAIEQQLEQIVASLLRVRKVDRDDNFFLLGGPSLLGTQVITRARASFGIELSLRTIFEFPTIAGLAGEIERLRKNLSGALSPRHV